jgi:hypothetical protein
VVENPEVREVQVVPPVKPIDPMSAVAAILRVVFALNVDPVPPTVMLDSGPTFVTA